MILSSESFKFHIIVFFGVTFVFLSEPEKEVGI